MTKGREGGGGIKYVKLGYHLFITHLFTLLFMSLVLFGILSEVSLKLDDIWQLWKNHILKLDLLSLVTSSLVVLLVFFTTVYVMSRPRTIYLVDYACYLAQEPLKVPMNYFLQHIQKFGLFDPKSIHFQQMILERSGLGDNTYLPSASHNIPPSSSMKISRAEAEAVVFGCLDELFEKTKVKPKDIGVLVVNCSLFNPTPSLSAMIVNKYKMRGNIRSFNLGGMGCSASVISIDLAKDILQAHHGGGGGGGTYAIVVSTENITQNWYYGNQRSMLIPNCLFRLGGAAILLSNRARDRSRSKYKLDHVVRTHKGADDKSYQCVYQQQDETGHIGVSLSKDLMAIAGDALKTNITTLGPLVLPLSEQILFFIILVARKVFNFHVKPYVPDFKLAFQHFCIHAGGRGVIDALEKNLQLTPELCEPSRMTLHRFGNTSSSSIWYELAYIEAKGRMRKGNRVWQIAFGSGFKCNSAVWQALRTIQPESQKSPWAHCISQYPVKIPEVYKFNWTHKKLWEIAVFSINLSPQKGPYIVLV